MKTTKLNQANLTVFIRVTKCARVVVTCAEEIFKSETNVYFQI